MYTPHEIMEKSILCIKKIPFKILISETDNVYYYLNVNHDLMRLTEEVFYDYEKEVSFKIILTNISGGGYNMLIGWPIRDELTMEENMHFNQFYNNICSNIRKMGYIINIKTNVMFKPCMRQIFFK